MIKHFTENFTWENVELLPYKETGNHFKSITRQVLSAGVGDMSVEMRYFEIAPGGHSTLEKHLHGHLVLILRGKGRVLVGTEINEIGEHDLVEIHPLTWHQFHSTMEAPLGFLCIVNKQRDKPHLPNAEDLLAMRSILEVRDFIRV